MVRLQDGHIVRRHIDAIRACPSESPTIRPEDDNDPLLNHIVLLVPINWLLPLLPDVLSNRRPPARLTYGPAFS